MHIDSITAKNLKGNTFTEDLEPVTVFVGPNNSGKSARMDAIRLAFLGYLPELGNVNSSTFQLASGSTLHVGVQMSSGHEITRTWKQKGKSITADVQGELPPAPSVMLNPTEYFALSLNKRADYIFNRIPLDSNEFSEEGVKQSLLRRTTNAPSAISYSKFVGEIPKQGNAQFQVWLQSVIEEYQDMLKRARDASKRYSSTLASSSELEPDSAPVEDNIDELIERERGMRDEIGKLQAFITEQTNLKNLIDREQALIDNSDESLESELAEAEEEKKAKSGELQSLFDQIQVKEPEVQELSNSTYQANNKLADADERLSKLEEEMESLSKEDRCPHCGTPGKQWKPAREAKINAEIKALKDSIEKSLKPEAEKLTDAYLAKKAELEKLRDRVGSVRHSEQMLAEKVATLEKKSNAVELAQQRIAELPKPKDVTAELLQLDSIQKALPAIREKISTAKQATQKAAAAKERERQNAKLKMEIKKADDDAEALKAIIEELQKIVKKAVEFVFASLMGKANQLVEGIMTHPLVYRDGEIGLVDNGVFVSWKTFGGTYQALTFAAICVAFAASSPFKLVMFDEMGRLDQENKKALIARIYSLASKGEIDQFIGVDVDGTAYDGETKINVKPSK